jgi:cytochrome o ubiquinol oxidase operon protein cyoD
MTSQQPNKSSHLKNYVIGFILSVILTLLAFLIVWQSLLQDIYLVGSLIILAISQLYVQVIFFFNLDTETKPKWNTMAFLFMMLIVLIVVLGSLWIMTSLDYNMMPDEVDTYLLEEEGISP